MTTAPIDRLSDRIRAALPTASIREVRMFGAHCFMVDGSLAVGANGDGSLLAHVERDDAAHLQQQHVTRAEMGAGRSMGPGWIRVDAAGLSDDIALARWIEAALHRGAAR